jgi:hypothetical protein
MKGFEILKEVLGFAKEGEIKWKIFFKDAEEAIECGIMYLEWGDKSISWARNKPKSFWCKEFGLSYGKNIGHIGFVGESRSKELSITNWERVCEEVKKIDSKLKINNENYAGRVFKWGNKAERGKYVKVNVVHEVNREGDCYGAFDVLNENGVVIEEDVLMRVVRDEGGSFKFYKAGFSFDAPEIENAESLVNKKVRFGDIDLSSSYIVCESKDQVERVLSFFNPYSQKVENVGIKSLFVTDLVMMVFMHNEGWLSSYTVGMYDYTEVRAENILGVDQASEPEKKEENSFKIPAGHYISFRNVYEVYEYIENNFIDSAPKKEIKINIKYLIGENSKMPGFCCEEIKDWKMGFGYGYEEKYKEINYEDYLKMKNSSPAQEFFDMLYKGVHKKKEEGPGIDYGKFVGKKIKGYSPFSKIIGSGSVHDDYIGVVGTIDKFITKNLSSPGYVLRDIFLIKFDDGNEFYYPADETIKYLLSETENYTVKPIYSDPDFVLDSCVDPNALLKSDSISHGDFFVVKDSDPDYDKIKLYCDLLQLARQKNKDDLIEALSHIHKEIYKSLTK